MTDRELLIWIHQRLVKVHGESPLVDYMHRLRDVIHGMPKDRDSAGRVVTMHSHDVLKEIELSDPPQVRDKDARQQWLRSYTWVQENGAIDYTKPRMRPEGLPVHQAELVA
jgi:hypothetical protein